MLTNLNLSQPVRLHGKLIHYQWSRLWYFLRGVSGGSGYTTISVSELLDLFEVSRATLYRWLQEGAKSGAFRKYYSEGKNLFIYLGSKFVVTRNLGLEDWGGTIEMPLRQCLRRDFYHLASLIQTAELQRASWWAAKFNLEKSDKKRKLMDTTEFFKGATSTVTSSDMPTDNEVHLQKFKIRKIIKGFALTRRSFIPIGATQKAIAQSIGLCDRSIRNHQWGVKRIQLCYQISFSEFAMREKIGEESWESSGCFQSSNMFWKYGTNIYDLNFQLKSEKMSHMIYEFFLLKKNSAGGQDKDKNLLCSSHNSKSFREFKKDWYRKKRKKA